MLVGWALLILVNRIQTASLSARSFRIGSVVYSGKVYSIQEKKGETFSYIKKPWISTIKQNVRDFCSPKILTKTKPVYLNVSYCFCINDHVLTLVYTDLMKYTETCEESCRQIAQAHHQRCLEPSTRYEDVNHSFLSNNSSV